MNNLDFVLNLNGNGFKLLQVFFKPFKKLTAVFYQV